MRGGSTGRHSASSAADAIVTGRDRDRAFRRARRHTWLVRFLKLTLPLAALAALLVYGGVLYATSRLKGRDIVIGKVAIDPTNLTMEDPRYSGFAKDGSEYKVHARSAVTDLRMSGPIKLNLIDGEIIQPAGTVTRLKAKWGTFDQKKDLLELYERIDVEGSNGTRAVLTRATVHAKESRILSPEPVYAETPTGRIRGNAMVLDTKSRRAAFSDGVEVAMRSAADLQSASPGTQAARREPGPFGISASSSEPLVVTSRRLDVDDAAHTALFRETVVARQGEASLEAPELDVRYTGRPDAGTPAAVVPGVTDAAGQARLKSLQARGGVHMSNKGDTADAQTLDYDAETERIALDGNVVLSQQPDRRVTAAAALLDQKADTALLSGDVVVNQGRNVLRGGRLAIDRKAGTAKLSSPAETGRAAGRISTLFYQSEAQQKGGAAPKLKVAADEGTEQPLGPLGSSFKTDPNAPIEVEAATLDVNDRKHTAVYVGAVVARQGAFTVRTDEMTAHYSGETGLTASGPAQRREAVKGGPGGSELRRIEARRNVVVTGSDGQQATGEWANFDVKANTIVMGGNVTVSQGRQIVRANEGKRLVIDLGTGISRFEADPSLPQAKAGPQVSGAIASPPVAAGAAPAPTAAPLPGCPPGAVCKSGRLEAIFYPHQVKEKAKQKLDSVAPGAASRGAAAIEAWKGKARSAPEGAGTSSWSATPQPAPRP